MVYINLWRSERNEQEVHSRGVVVHSINQHAGYYEIMEQIIRQLVFDATSWLAVGKHLLEDLCVVGRPPTPSHPHTHACLVTREKQFLCACGKTRLHAYKRERTE
jgi:hypothetical protein